MAFLGLIPELAESGQSSVKVNLTMDQAHREATGRALILMGSMVSMVGSVMVLSVNPAMKQQATGIWKYLPASFQRNKSLVIIGTGITIASLMALKLRKKNSTRYNLD